MTCIFCSGSAAASTVEHILPESLGGGDWACLPAGLVCAACNQYFGSKVEPDALGSFPFLPFRVLLGIPTKKGLPAKMENALGAGTILGQPIPGRIGFIPSNVQIEAGVESGAITRMTFIADPISPAAVCRLLLKMGLEVIAQDNPDDALSHRYDAARQFARHPKRGSEWWFHMRTNHEALFKQFREGISWNQWQSGVSLSVDEVEGAEVFHLRLLEMSVITPMHPNIVPDGLDALPEPEHRLFKARI